MLDENIYNYFPNVFSMKTAGIAHCARVTVSSESSTEFIPFLVREQQQSNKGRKPLRNRIKK